MTKTALLLVGAAVWALVSCGSEPETPPVSAPGPAAAGLESSFAGLYEVEGLTVEKETGVERQISGKIILSQQGDRYTSTFDLHTMFASPSGPLATEVIGKGEGSVDGNVLTGTAETQLMISTVAGLDARFAYIPRRVSQRLLSTSIATITPDGSITIEIESEPAEGQTYASSMTTLTGTMVPPHELRQPRSARRLEPAPLAER